MIVRSLEERTKANPPASPPPWAPDYVHACHEERWTIHFRDSTGAERGFSCPFRCGSRHHPGPCQDFYRRRLYARVVDPIGRLMQVPVEDLVFLTFTLPPRWHAFPDEASRRESYKGISRGWGRFWRALRKRAVRAGYESVEFLRAFEAHKSGIAHGHAVMYCPFLADLCRARDAELAELGVELDPDDAHLAPAAIRALGEACGLGERMDLQLVESREAVAGYASKVVGTVDEREAEYQHGRLAGEVTKAANTSVERLPKGTRTYGTTRGFIAPKRKSKWTGRVYNEDGLRVRSQRWEGYEEARARVTEQLESLEEMRARPVVDWDNELAYWDDQAEAARYSADHLRAPVGRTYRLDPELRYQPAQPRPPPEHWSADHIRRAIETGTDEDVREAIRFHDAQVERARVARLRDDDLRRYSAEHRRTPDPAEKQWR